MEKQLQFTLATESEPRQVRDILLQELKLTPHQISQAKFRRNGICIQDRQVRITDYLNAQETLHILVEEKENGSAHLIPIHGNLDILYEDEDLIVLNKESGMVTHPVGGHYQDSLTNLLAGYFQVQGHNVTIRPIGRLDKETSGLVVFAKNQIAASRLDKQRESGAFNKEYLALVSGRLPSAAGIICEPIGAVPSSHMKMQVCKNGRYAKTQYEVLQEFPDYTLIKCTLFTGRTHQIRVHLSWLGHPLLGDELYRTPLSSECEIDRAALHCHRMKLCQPFGKNLIEIESPVPWDMSFFMQ